ncbi:sensor histidine kinase [Streptomyces sp. NBC_01497]|uniref:sensor histidine kinase n=1 Tax=Streptomyces sp. NBC_01497 TaxID=2903885 RepID=UPI002E32DF4E|nr:HAMP domain-containing sensor histidine kinase [Streptomyces sp. NBC_01497]
MRLSTRLGLAVGLTLPLLVLASGWLVLQFVSRDLSREQDQHLRDRVAAVVPEASTVLKAAAADRPDTVEQARARRLYADALDVGVRVTGPDGTFAGGPQPGPDVRLPAKARQPVTVRDRGRQWRVLSRSLTMGRASVTGTLWVFSPDTAARTQLGLVRRRVAMAALVAAPLGGAVGWGIATGATRPLRRLQQATNGLDPRTSSVRFQHRPTGTSEVDDLADTMATVLDRYDEQAARIAQALDTARSFSSAASHEMRTPLMSMGTNLDIIEAHSDLPAQDRAEIVGELRAEHARLRNLLDELRALGRADLVESNAFHDTDVAEIAESAVAEARRRAPEAVVRLRTGTDTVMNAWEPGLRLMLDNLLANALIHGCDPAGAVEVDVVLERNTDELILTVDDRGPGIPSGVREEMFARFRRGPGSSGSGLGLTLVAQQAALHRGTAEAGERPGGHGCRVTVRLPTSQGISSAPARFNWLRADPERPSVPPRGPRAKPPSSPSQDFPKKRL